MSDLSKESEKVEDSVQKKETKEEVVARKAYEQVQRDMHKYKSQAKEAELAKNEYESKLKALEEAQMVEQEQWKQLYEKTKSEVEAERAEAQRKNELYVKSVKMSALKQELGNVQNEYLIHADISSIELNDDGTINSDSLHKVSNEFREKHSVLIPPSNPSQITTQASPTDSTVSLAEKSLNEMTLKEKQIYLKQLKQK